MASVSVNPPKTPVTKGSNGIATATIPNVCKMPGTPFVPTPLPNIGRSGLSPKDYSTSVQIEGNEVAIRGSTFESIGDVASKATGGGLISANTQGITKFVGPGSMDVKIEGKNVQLLSDPMLNNCGPGGSPPNAATMLGVLQGTLVTAVEGERCPLCNEPPHQGLRETDDPGTRADAAALAASYDTHRRALPRSHRDAKRPTMLGVVHCKCARKYADQSGSTSGTLRLAARDSGMIYPEGVTEVREAIRARVGNDMLFNRLWQEAHNYSVESAGDESLPIGYPPGSCAGPKVLVLARNNGGLPIAMTERWYHPKGEGHGPSRRIRYVDAISPTGERVVRDGEFDHGDTVPPCMSCHVLLPMLLCFQEEDPCPHSSGSSSGPSS